MKIKIEYWKLKIGNWKKKQFIWSEEIKKLLEKRNKEETLRKTRFEKKQERKKEIDCVKCC